MIWISLTFNIVDSIKYLEHFSSTRTMQSKPSKFFEENARTARRRRKFREFMMFDRIWSTFPALGQCSRSLLKLRGKCWNCPPQAKMSRIYYVWSNLEHFSSTRTMQSKPSKISRKMLEVELPAAGENFENLWCLIEFGALFQHSDNAVEAF